MKAIHFKGSFLIIGVMFMTGCVSTPMKTLTPSELVVEKKSKYETLPSADGLTGWEKGLWFYKHYQYKEAIPLLEPHKNKGIAEVEHAYGYMNAHFKKNHKTAIEWYRKAIKHGNLPNSLNNLAVYYTNGVVVAKDDSKATELFLQSAKQGYGIAQFSLAFRYCSGNGASEDHGKAYYWFQQAYHNGNSAAAEKIGHMYELPGHSFKIDYQKALEWYTLAAKMGNKKGEAGVVRIKYKLDATRPKGIVIQ